VFFITINDNIEYRPQVQQHTPLCGCMYVCNVCVCVCVVVALQGVGFVDLSLQDVLLVDLVHLLQEDEGQDGVRTQTGVVRSEAFP